MQTITEGKARIKIDLKDKVSKEMPVFYNPVMKLNRDIAVLLLNSVRNKRMQIADPLAASGIRSIRFFKELKKGKIEAIEINDISAESIRQIKANLKLNKLGIGNKKTGKVKLHNKDANIFLLESTGFDYIDIDPFGYPGKFLNNAIARLSRGGILAVTATDTAALSGTFPTACQRKYLAKPLLNYLMHETGLRILIRFVQLIGAMHEKAMVPIFSHSNDHYMRAYFLCEKGKEKADEIIKKHKYLLLNKKDLSFKTSSANCGQGYDFAGPLWTGQLWDKKLTKKMLQTNKNPGLNSFLKIIYEETKTDAIGFYNIHKLCKIYKLKIPLTKEIIKRIKQKEYWAAKTHFSKYGLRTDISLNKLLNIIKIR